MANERLSLPSSPTCRLWPHKAVANCLVCRQAITIEEAIEKSLAATVIACGRCKQQHRINVLGMGA